LVFPQHLNNFEGAWASSPWPWIDARIGRQRDEAMKKGQRLWMREELIVAVNLKSPKQSFLRYRHALMKNQVLMFF